ncbi:copper amine oxidase [Aspergillus fischeri NRRL 181]|uniref:Amine oxidase n=1 Tax=Neosartorya fischeri (strain ATCC 1020 / DSM 3700 / CBS 544.65 / FGSC A1164 / JCM 1740 / NRRL 181 / WB 181) TaxID=331117 RepID=A1DA34_NEOFI|nr:copper amine oxidase [Aspergillus fischeri NRRL 181]EAW20665.1 copper amine oxidase [Aspergillus fischeri NRRL 181]
MVVPYGCPEPPHHRKQAFDVGEHGMGLMANSFRLGCNCKGAIQYLDGGISDQQGAPVVVKNAICIHEEDNGLLVKDTDFRDARSISARRLIISQIVTAANYDYGSYHTFTLDGTYKLRGQTANPYGTEVARGVIAHNHQHVFSLRIDPEIDGMKIEVRECDAIPLQYTDDSKTNPYGDGFFCQQRAVEGDLLCLVED